MKIYKIKRYYHKTFDNTYSFIGHTHNSYELNIVLNGTLEVTVGKSVLQLSAGDSLFWSPMQFHCNRVVSEGCTEFLSIIFSEEGGDDTSEDRITFSRLTPSTNALVDLLINEWESGKQSDDANTALFTALILRLQNDSITTEFLVQSDALIYKHAVELMSETPYQMYLLPQIAHHCGVCETTLKKVFKQYAGVSVKRYYIDLKMQFARKLLQSGKSANETAAALGFSSLSYFSQCFKNNNGINVREYLKTLPEQKTLD